MRLKLTKSTALTSVMLLLATAFSAPASAGTFLDSQVLRDPGAVDQGLAPTTEVKHLVFSLTLQNSAALTAYIASTAERGNPNFRKFLTTKQFGATYGQSTATIASVTSYLASHGVTITKVYANNLIIDATATNAQLASLFGSPIHTFKYLGQTYERPVGKTTIPAGMPAVISGVLGLNTQPLMRAHKAVVPRTGAAATDNPAPKLVVPTPKSAATGTPGQWTVKDFAAKYNVTPLYANGVTGAGTTLAILTFGDFVSSDVFAYWSAVGLNVDSNRITKVCIDSVSTPCDNVATDADSEGETSIDIEQAGGLAPGANIRVYEAPNTNQGFLDLYATAITENLSDTYSTSWGGPEFENGTGSNPIDFLLLEAASEGAPFSAAAGDAGAYDANDLNGGLVYPTCTTMLSVDYPASSPFVLAAGGTTVPSSFTHKYGVITVPTERAWAWDYLRTYVTQHYGQAYYWENYFPTGGGGGVSIQYPAPFYQGGLPGVQNSAPGQTLICETTAGPDDLLSDPTYDLGFTTGVLPSGYPGRNLPDVALNADPYSGYLLYQGGSWAANWGGTSFVAPQLNGVFALITQSTGGRIGWINPQLYAAFAAQGYSSGSPFYAVTSGDNEFYTSAQSYNPATGLGSLNVGNLANALTPLE
jgi:subtilase family serine protease